MATTLSGDSEGNQMVGVAAKNVRILQPQVSYLIHSGHAYRGGPLALLGLRERERIKPLAVM